MKNRTERRSEEQNGEEECRTERRGEEEEE